MAGHPAPPRAVEDRTEDLGGLRYGRVLALPIALELARRLLLALRLCYTRGIA